MKITFYGTSASEGWPALFCNCKACETARLLGGKNLRTRSQSLIDTSLLIDFPPDTNYHALQYGLNLRNIRTLLITHSHHDHIFASDICMRMQPFAESLDSVMTVYGDEYVCALFYEAAKYFPGLEKTVRFLPACAFQPFFTDDGYEVVPLSADHNYPEHSLLYIIRKGNKSLLYAHDTGLFPEATAAYLKNMHFDLISLDCTALERNWFHGHMGFSAIDQTVKFLKNQNVIDDHTQIILNHFAHYKNFTHAKICEQMEPKGYTVAYDGLELSF